MKYTFTILAALLAFVEVGAQELQAVKSQPIFDGEVTVHDFSFTRNGDYMFVNMDIDLSELNVHNNRATVLSPVIVNQNNQIDLNGVGIYGRRRYFTYVRNGWSTLGNEGDMLFKESEKPEIINFSQSVPYEDWMNGAKVVVGNRTYGCCNKVLDERFAELGSYRHWVYAPHFAFVRPQAEAVKTRELSGSAFVDFPVSQTVIYPEYRNNVVELAKITGTIDSVRNDSDITVTAISIKGFASPESPYDNNTRLAKGRTEALRVYVNKLYNFPENFIATDYEPENWEGLRAFVEQSSLPHRREIIALIDGDREPDNKEWKLKSTYPEEYRYLLKTCYPALRRSDYRIEYIVRGFSDVEEIRRLVKERPQKLSLEEFYLAAQGLESGSDEFCEIFDVAVRMYPKDEVANLNAANSAMMSGNMKGAERFLEKAGKSDEAIYARGVFAALEGDYDAAEDYFRLVENAIPEAKDGLEQLAKLRE
ncbi:MAG: DUF3868 domain-containing protein [Rikenellaceae bacterium]|nr:DUF3868 domain-containing protein [Rikenellaceae bacterium]